MDALSLIADLVAGTVADDWPPQVVDYDLWAQSVAAQTLADTVAPMLGCLADDAFYSLLKIPNNLLPMLHSPEGWSALAAYIAGDQGLPPLNYFPAVH